MPIDPQTLESLRLTYGDILEIPYKDVFGEERSFVIRKPNFREYCFYNLHVIPVPGTDKFELDPNVADLYLSWIVIYPKDVKIADLPPGLVIKACLASIDLHPFENKEILREMYTTAYRNSRTILGAIVQRLLMTYGIDFYLRRHQFTEEEIIELIVISELAHNDAGTFAQLAGIANGLPFTKRGILDVDALLGLKPAGDQSTGQTHPEIDILKAKYKSMGMSDQEITEILYKLEKSGQVDLSKVHTQQQNGQIDLNREDAPNLTREEYLEAKRSGKLVSFEESQRRALAEAKTALQLKIEEDRALYGDKYSNKPKTPLGQKQLSSLLKEIKRATADLR